MSWLEVPFLLGVCGILYNKLEKIDTRQDRLAEELSELKGILSDIPKRKTDI